VPGSLSGQHHRRFDGCLSVPTAWLSLGPRAERVLSSNWETTTESALLSALKGWGLRAREFYD